MASFDLLRYCPTTRLLPLQQTLLLQPGVRSKHIDVRFLKVREYVANGDLRVVHVRTDYNVADFFTKGLTIAKFSNFRNLLMGEQKSHTKTPTTAAPTGIYDKGKIRTVARGFDETVVAPGSNQAKHPMWGIVKTAATPISPSPSPETVSYTHLTLPTRVAV